MNLCTSERVHAGMWVGSGVALMASGQALGFFAVLLALSASARWLVAARRIAQWHLASDFYGHA